MSTETATASRPQPRPEDMLTVAQAAPIARRSIRTLRRAYRDGSLRAYRDGNGRTIRIEYGDLRDWMKRNLAAPPCHEQIESAPPRISAVERPRPERLNENLHLLEVARSRGRQTRRR